MATLLMVVGFGMAAFFGLLIIAPQGDSLGKAIGALMAGIGLVLGLIGFALKKNESAQIEKEIKKPRIEAINISSAKQNVNSTGLVVS